MSFTFLLCACLTLSVPINAFYSQLQSCPEACDILGLNPANWTHYHDVNVLQYCNQTTLFDLSLYNDVSTADNLITIRACVSTGLSHDLQRRQHIEARSSNATTFSSSDFCDSSVDPKPAEFDVEFSYSGTTDQSNSRHIVAAVKELAAAVASSANCNTTIQFAQSANVIAGAYIGSQLDKKSAAAVMQKFADQVKADVVGEQMSIQSCGDKLIGTQLLGVFVDTKGDLSAAQAVLRDWNEARCLLPTSNSNTDIWEGTSISILPAIQSKFISSKRKRHVRVDKHKLVQRSTCTYAQAGAGDGCWALAQKCGITQEQLIKFNPAPDFCNNTLIAGQYVCCSAGSLPDFSPKPNPDGSCFAYQIQVDDICKNIATAHYMTVADIKKYNKNTWGWMDCNLLQVGQLICLSTGDPPMPVSVSNAECGPQVPGTIQPPKGTNISQLNPCPLNVCCDIWGQCGIGPEFCTIARAATGAPGTAKKGTNGCISHCSMEIKNNAVSPPEFRRIGYFEGFNLDRPCMHMDISKIGPPYSHVHFAFGGITDDFKVDISHVKDQFDGLVKLTGIKRILSFGGWSFSTKVDTFPIFRQGVTAANRQKFANLVVKFAVDNNLDGLDFDWEYPGAPDLPNVPPGSPEDGANYLKFLKLVRNALPANKSLSIAAPASYWYLRGFPIKEMSQVLDYIVYMTYDLHGQWDYNNTFADTGCPKGGCLRSHINGTEVDWALSMITKAGVPASKVVVGMPLYGRSFEMADSSCKGPECRFTAAGAKPAICTNSSGYISNVEIRDIIANSNGSDIQQYNDQGDVLIYDTNQWVSWMTPSTYALRMLTYLSENLGGVSDWAVDLDHTYMGMGGTGEESTRTPDDDVGDPCDLQKTFKSLNALKASAPGMDSSCRNIYALQVLSDMLDASWSNYTDINNGYDKKFDEYVRFVKSMIPAAIDRFMQGNGTTSIGPGMQYFDCAYSAQPDDSEKKPCNTYSDLYEGDYEMWWFLREPDDFYSALLDKYGIMKDWIALNGTHDAGQSCVAPPGSECPPNYGTRTWHGYPIKVPNVEVANPKDIVTQSIGNVQKLQNNITSTMLDIMLGNWDGSYEDVVQVMSVPVFTLQQAVEGMAQVKIIAKKEEEIEAEEKKELILLILGVIFCIVPFIGEATAETLGLASLARMANLIGEAGNAGLGAYDIVKNPDSAPMAIVGMILGTGGVAMAARDAKGFAAMASIRRGMSAKVVGDMGTVFKKHDDTLQSILNACVKA